MLVAKKYDCLFAVEVEISKGRVISSRQPLLDW